MDFSKYKKVKEDKQSTTMQSDAGHTITLMHAKMPRIQIEQLKRLKMGDGGRVGLHIPIEKRAKLADAGEVGDAAAEQDVSVQDSPIQAPQGQPNPAVNMVPADVPAEVPAQQSYAPNVNPQTGQTNPGAVNANSQAVAQNQGQVNAAAAQAEIPQNVAYIKAMQQVAQQQQEAYNDIAKHTSDFAQHMQGVDPQHFVKSMPGGEKVLTSLGLLIGGFTQGYHGGNNAASDWLNNQINKDIDAQKNAQDVNKTVYGAYRDLYGDSKAATAATKASMADIYAQMGKQIALKYGTQNAMIAAQNLANTAASATPKLLKEGAVDLTNLPGGRGMGAPAPAGGHTPQGAKKQGNYILAPDAQHKLDALAWRATYDPAAAAQLPIAQQQHQSAVQAEKALQEIDRIFPLAAQSTTTSGSIANAIEDTVGEIPFGIGKVLGNLPGEAIRDLGGQKEKLNKSYSTQLEGYISAALEGTGATPTDKGQMAREYKPLASDSPEVKKAKLEGLKQKIIALQKSSALGAAGMLKK